MKIATAVLLLALPASLVLQPGLAQTPKPAQTQPVQIKEIPPTQLPPPGSFISSTASTPEARDWAAKNLKGWPPERQALAAHLVAKYGQPQDSSPRQISWFDNGPWKRTVLYRDGDLHKFPLSHRDVLWQTVNYKVALNRIAAILAYNGSILIDRTRGEITAHCDTEEDNMLTLNLADNVATGSDTVEQAKAYHAQVFEGLRIREPSEYAYKLRFATPGTNAATADPGEEAELLIHLRETSKDK